MPEELDAKWREVEENAKAGCWACQNEAEQEPPGFVKVGPHDCLTTMTVAANAMKAAFDIGAVAAFPAPDDVRRHCQPDILIRVGKAKQKLEAAIDKKLEEATG